MKILSKIGQFFEDGDGFLSSTRLAFLLVIFSGTGIWAWTSIINKKFEPFDNSFIYLIVTLMTGKVAQSFSENNSSLPNNTINK